MITRIHHALLASLLAVTHGLVAAQDDRKPEPAPPDVKQLVEQLGDDSFKVRREAEQALRRHGKAAVEELRAAVERHADAEVQWRAKRLLKHIEGGGPQGGLAPRRPGDGSVRGPDRHEGFWVGPGRGGDLGERFDSLFEQIERELGTPIPRAQFFGGEFFKQLEEQLDEFRRGQAMGLPGKGQAFSMRIDNDGVRVEITERGEDGKSETKVYEAPDVETFRSKYPEVAERHLRDGGARFFSFGTDQWPQLRLLSPDSRAWTRLGPAPLPQVATEDTGDRLGVYVEEVPAPVREFLGLPAGKGLSVQSVLPGSVAEAAGIEEGDVLLEVAGRPVASPEDVRAAIGSVEAGAAFAIKVNRRGAERELKGTRSEAREEKKPAGEQGERKLEKRAGGDAEDRRTIR